MRTNIVHIGAGELNYEIRNIVRIADKMQALGLKINMENIGDPVAKGEEIPGWMKAIVSDLCLENCAYGYCPTQGDLATRKFLAERTNRCGGAHITPEDIIFFNGLGDAITKIYGFLRRTARVVTPSPTYTTHSSSEAAHAGMPAVCYPLEPENNWHPNLEELRNQVRYNTAVAGILLINPDNPTGLVYPEHLLREIVSIAKEFDLFLIADEIYQNLCFEGWHTRALAEVVDDVPAISMKGISKELPWPGARCGWIEVYNADKDPHFAQYIQSILNAKMVEVCSTTLPQKAIPRIFEHPAYAGFLDQRRRRYQALADIAAAKLGRIGGVRANRPRGAFYMSVVFEPGRLNGHQQLPIENPRIKSIVEELTAAPGIQPDRRMVYYVLGATGICLVPLTSFSTEHQGFRMTLLETDTAEFEQMLDKLSSAVEAYLESHARPLAAAMIGGYPEENKRSAAVWAH